LPLQFVAERLKGRGSRPKNATLNLTSYIDFLLVTVIFLLMSFSASGDFGVDRHITLPSAGNVEDVLEATVVAVNGNQVLVDGVMVDSTRRLEEAGRMIRVDGLFDLLVSKRSLWQSMHPGTDFPGLCILQIDREVPAVVVKSVFQTAAYAGYGNVSFMVKKRA